MADLTLKDRHGDVIEKKLPGGKVKKKAKNEVILETNTRSKKKCVTTILGARLPIYRRVYAQHMVACDAQEIHGVGQFRVLS